MLVRRASYPRSAIRDRRHLSGERNSPLADIFANRRSNVPSCAGRVREPLGAESGTSILRIGELMLSDKRFLEAGLLVAVPICVAITALIVLLTLARI